MFTTKSYHKFFRSHNLRLYTIIFIVIVGFSFIACSPKSASNDGTNTSGGNSAAGSNGGAAAAVGTAGLQYVLKTDGSSYIVSSGSVKSGAVVIPSVYNGLPVSAVNSTAFENSDITSITISNGVTSIGLNAFSNCKNLASITIPNSVTSIGQGAFNNCVNLTSVIIPNNVTSISQSLFYNCTNLTSVTIGNNVTSIDARAFNRCSKLASITIPASVDSIGNNAFNNTIITSVTFRGTIEASKFARNAFPGDLNDKHRSGGIGTYTRPDVTSTIWTKR
jgi:hypothetical protein